MNLNNLTLKAQSSVQQAFNIAAAKGQQAVECAHLLKGIMTEAESVTEFLFGKMGVNSANLSRSVEKLIDSYPKVSGAEAYLSSTLSDAIRKANGFASGMKDQFVTAEHLLMGILVTSDKASGLLKDNGVTMAGLKASIDELRIARQQTTHSIR